MRLLLVALASLSAVSLAAPLDFSRDILPILSDKCYHCHGPDEEKREAKLRLDTKEGLYRTLDGVTVVKPGSLEESELITRIISTDKDDMMPPPKLNRPMKPEEIATLKRWVSEGAPFGQHWSFAPMKHPQPPGAGNPIDAFVRARLNEEHLAPAPEADRERLIRRVTFDLTGLPPALAEIDAFLSDPASDAYEKAVDRLLNSPRFGERMATEWLDLARFADTFGYQADAASPMWPYRDWVIRAFNENMPFDQFVRWQLAGDLLPGATKEQRLATAFNRLHMQNEEGGIVEEEFRITYNVDRVNTFGTAFLGMTFECSRCHDHKYDPISQRDFYSLLAFFQNIDESGQKPFNGFSTAVPVPTLLLSTEAQDQQIAALQREIEAKQAELTRSLAALSEAAPQAAAGAGAVALPRPDLIAAFDFDALDKGQSPSQLEAGLPAKAHEKPELTEGRRGKAILLDGEDGLTFPGVGHFSRSDEFSLSLWIKPAAPTERAVVLHHTKAPIDAGSRGYEIVLEKDRVAVGLAHMWPGNAIKIVTRQPIPAQKWTHLTATYDGSSRAAGVKIYLDGRLAETETIRDGLTKDITYSPRIKDAKEVAKGEPDLTLGYRFRDNGFKGGSVDELRVFSRELAPSEAAVLAGQAERVGFDAYLSAEHGPARQLRRELRDLRLAQAALIDPIPEAMVMQELPVPKKAHILKRGAYDTPGDEVTADTPHAMPAFPKDAPRNRLGLAQWLLDPEHPLMARVTVNRLWQTMFGRGLVETAENFGTQGAQPTHPELLDWLARDFIAQGWDVKRALRQIALSATYRQSSLASPELMSRDPQNLLLARGPARRLTAEMLRDQALALSGLLVEKLGGPSVKPYQPPGLWEAVTSGARYDQGKGEDLYRRSLYTFWKRTVPPPVMMTFDAADRSNCAVRRQSTSTPLQALATLNDVQVVEAARFLAQRMLREAGPSEADRTTWAFRTITGRHPSEKETAVLTRLYREQHALFTEEPGAATALASVGESRTAPLPPADLAAGTVLAKALLNHDEALMRR